MLVKRQLRPIKPLTSLKTLILLTETLHKMQFSFPKHSHDQPNPLTSFIQTLATQANQFLNSTLKPQATQFLNSTLKIQPLPPPWAHIFLPNNIGTHKFDLALATPEIEERLAGVPVYALSNAAEEFVLVSGARTGKSLGLFCFKKEDAEALLDQMRSMNMEMREGSRVVPVALNKVFQLKVDGVAFRLIPDPHQVANAIKEKERIGDNVEDFHGVPVFQAQHQPNQQIKENDNCVQQEREKGQMRSDRSHRLSLGFWGRRILEEDKEEEEENKRKLGGETKTGLERIHHTRLLWMPSPLLISMP